METFSIRFFMENRKPQTANLRMSRDHGFKVAFAVCNLRLNGRMDILRVSDLRQGFFPLKSVQPHV